MDACRLSIGHDRASGYVRHGVLAGEGGVLGVSDAVGRDLAAMRHKACLKEGARTHAPSNVIPIRTPEQIREQLEARYAELELEAAKIAATLTCKGCRFLHHQAWCTNRLVTGFQSKDEFVGLKQEWIGVGKTKLCGPERALWEPKPNLLDRLIEWLIKRFPSLAA